MYKDKPQRSTQAARWLLAATLRPLCRQQRAAFTQLAQHASSAAHVHGALHMAHVAGSILMDKGRVDNAALVPASQQAVEQLHLTRRMRSRLQHELRTCKPLHSLVLTCAEIILRRLADGLSALRANSVMGPEALVPSRRSLSSLYRLRVAAGLRALSSARARHAARAFRQWSSWAHCCRVVGAAEDAVGLATLASGMLFGFHAVANPSCNECGDSSALSSKGGTRQRVVVTQSDVHDASQGAVASQHPSRSNHTDASMHVATVTATPAQRHLTPDGHVAVQHFQQRARSNERGGVRVRRSAANVSPGPVRKETVPPPLGTWAVGELSHPCEATETWTATQTAQPSASRSAAFVWPLSGAPAAEPLPVTKVTTHVLPLSGHLQQHGATQWGTSAAGPRNEHDFRHMGASVWHR
mmetsp:Transcript_50337/g.93071  ORF Transcript_50337/g.93071 Transcript_50337/m.93071 type:complete len:413 (+) Transcript_50337:139-1377(+)